MPESISGGEPRPLHQFQARANALADKFIDERAPTDEYSVAENFSSVLETGQQVFVRREEHTKRPLSEEGYFEYLASTRMYGFEDTAALAQLTDEEKLTALSSIRGYPAIPHDVEVYTLELKTRKAILDVPHEAVLKITSSQAVFENEQGEIEPEHWSEKNRLTITLKDREGDEVDSDISSLLRILTNELNVDVRRRTNFAPPTPQTLETPTEESTRLEEQHAAAEELEHIEYESVEQDATRGIEDDQN